MTVIVGVLILLLISLVLFIGFIVLLLYPGFIFDYALRKGNIVNNLGGSLVRLYLSFSFGTLYWVFLSVIVFSSNLARNYFIISLILSLVGPFLFLLGKNLYARLSSQSSLINLDPKIVLDRNDSKNLAKLTMLIATVFFLVAIIVEAFCWPLPAGFDRNKHLAYVIWFIQKKMLMERYMGTTYNNFYPVGMHMFFALILAILLAILNFLAITNNIFTVPEGFGIISEVFVCISAFIIFMYPVALYFLTCLISKDKAVTKYTMLASLILLGFIVLIEPIHMLLGNLLVPFTLLFLDYSKFFSKKSLKKIFCALVVVAIFSATILIHIYAAIYHILIVVSIELVKNFTTYSASGRCKKVVFRRMLALVKAFIKTIFNVAFLLLISLMAIFILYPNYLYGIYQESIRVSKASQVLSELSKFSQTGKLWSIYNPRDPHFLPLYMYCAIRSMLAPFMFVGLLILWVFLLKLLMRSRSDTRKARKSQASSYNMKALTFMVVSAIYVFLPVVPKFGITEVKALYFLPMIIGYLVSEVVRKSNYVTENIIKRIRKFSKLSKKFCNFAIVVITILVALISTIEAINTMGSSRIGGYIDFSEVWHLAKVINLNVKENYTIVYPDGSRQMELLILETLIKNRVLLASISTDMPKQMELAKLYKICYIWKRGTFYRFVFNTSPEDILKIIVGNNIGAIISNPFFILDYRQIMSLFPNVRIIRISSYYTIAILAI